MIDAIEIENYKSIQKLKIKLGRVNLLIGENGCGKSNILEAIVLAGAAEANKLDNEFLPSRGIRVTTADLMRSNFAKENINSPIKLTISPKIEFEDDEIKNLRQLYRINPEGSAYTTWNVENKKLFDTDEHTDVEFNALTEGAKSILLASKQAANVEELLNSLNQEKFSTLQKKARQDLGGNKYSQIESLEEFIKTLKNAVHDTQELVPDASKSLEVAEGINKSFDTEVNKIRNFLIYSPENTALRTFSKEGQIEPLGINGEGLLKLIKVISDTDKKAFEDIVDALNLFGWFDFFEVPDSLSSTEDSILIKDKYIDTLIDQRIVNEGFLFVLFYIALIVSKDTPKIFAIDNIDASLNPALCTKIMEMIVKLSERYGKQIILTTHNPAVLDGLNILDKNQRLNVIYRDLESGETKLKAITPRRKPKSSSGEQLLMSEAMLRGYFGGLPEGF